MGAALIGGLLPPGVRWAEAREPAPAGPGSSSAAEALLFPEESAHAARFTAVRRAQFAAVRVCAREALGELGFAPGPILPGPRREPIWPDGVRGSMTHCPGYSVAELAARLLVPPGPLPALLRGRWAAADGLVATAIVLPGPSNRPEP